MIFAVTIRITIDEYNTATLYEVGDVVSDKTAGLYGFWRQAAQATMHLHLKAIHYCCGVCEMTSIKPGLMEVMSQTLKQ